MVPLVSAGFLLGHPVSIPMGLAWAWAKVRVRLVAGPACAGGQGPCALCSWRRAEKRRRQGVDIHGPGLGLGRWKVRLVAEPDCAGGAGGQGPCATCSLSRAESKERPRPGPDVDLHSGGRACGVRVRTRVKWLVTGGGSSAEGKGKGLTVAPLE